MTQKQIAIVNTNKNTPSALKSLLSDLGYGVECYTQVSTLIEFTKTRPTDVIIIESDIESNAGLNLVKTLNQLVTPIPIILLTNNGDLQSAVEAMKYGALNYIEKPIANSVLAKIVHQACLPM